MANFCKYFLLLTSSIFLLTSTLSSCQEGGDAGDLLGQWRLEGHDDMYVSFSGTIASFRSISDQQLKGEVFAKFQHKGDSLFMQCTSIKQQKSDTTMVEDGFAMKPFTNIRVKIDVLDGDRLQLSKDNQHWSFEKY